MIAVIILNPCINEPYDATGSVAIMKNIYAICIQNTITELIKLYDKTLSSVFFSIPRMCFVFSTMIIKISAMREDESPIVRAI